MNKQLKPDGSYTSNVYGSINGYTELGMERKRRLMLDAKALLREVAGHLAGMGLTGFALSYNPAGMAVSGDISAEYWSDVNPLQRVYITIGASFVLCGRKDGLAVMARTHHYEKVERNRKPTQFWPGSPRMGANQWLSAAMDSRQLADALMGIFSLDYQEVQFHTLSAAPIPSKTFCSTPEQYDQSVASRLLIERMLEMDMSK